MSLRVLSAAELQEAVDAAEFRPISRPLDLYEGASQAFLDDERRHYELFGPNSSERFGMGYGNEPRGGEFE